MQKETVMEKPSMALVPSSRGFAKTIGMVFFYAILIGLSSVSNPASCLVALFLIEK